VRRRVVLADAHAALRRRALVHDRVGAGARAGAQLRSIRLAARAHRLVSPWRRCGPGALGLLFAAGAITTLHGAQIMLRMLHQVGAIGAALSR
jgi:hypothetical protein